MRGKQTFIFLDEIHDVKYEQKVAKCFLETLQESVEKGEEKIEQITKALQAAKEEKKEAEYNTAKISQRFSDIKEEIHHWKIMEQMEEEIQQVLRLDFVE